MDFEKYTNLVNYFFENDNREENYQNRVLIPFFEALCIDSGYMGEVHAIISNVGNREYEIKEGDKVGQLVIMPILIPDFTFENWKERGNGAFGSTGR